MSESIISKYIERFRYEKPTSEKERKIEREKVRKEFWWLEEDEEKEKEESSIEESEKDADSLELKESISKPILDDQDILEEHHETDSISTEDSLDDKLIKSTKQNIDLHPNDFRFSYSNLELFESVNKSDSLNNTYLSELLGNDNTSDQEDFSLPSATLSESPRTSLSLAKVNPPDLPTATTSIIPDPLDVRVEELFKRCKLLLDEVQTKSDSPDMTPLQSLELPKRELDVNSNENSFREEGSHLPFLEAEELLQRVKDQIHQAKITSNPIPSDKSSVKEDSYDLEPSVRAKDPNGQQNLSLMVSESLPPPSLHSSHEAPSMASFYLSEEEDDVERMDRLNHQITSNSMKPTADTLSSSLPPLEMILHDYLSDEIVCQLWTQYCQKQEELRQLRKR